MTLFIDACAREGSRTRLLAERLLDKAGGADQTVRLTQVAFPAVDEAFLSERDRLTASGDLGSGLFALARQFAEADRIVIAAPYWDLSFPAVLKQYFEQINIPGITFEYTPEGFPKGLCRATALYYVTTAGGAYCPEAYGFGYVKALAQDFYGIPEVVQIKATGLDVDGADVEDIMARAVKALPAVGTA